MLILLASSMLKLQLRVDSRNGYTTSEKKYVLTQLFYLSTQSGQNGDKPFSGRISKRVLAEELPVFSAMNTKINLHVPLENTDMNAEKRLVCDVQTFRTDT